MPQDPVFLFKMMTRIVRINHWMLILPRNSATSRFGRSSKISVRHRTVHSYGSSRLI